MTSCARQQDAIEDVIKALENQVREKDEKIKELEIQVQARTEAAIETSAPSALAPPSSTTPCSMQHGGQKARSEKKYQLFYAAEAGCLECVERLMMREGVAAESQSDTKWFSVLDFAEWGKEKGQGRHADIISFLQDQIRANDPMECCQGVVPRQAAGSSPTPSQSFQCQGQHGGRKPVSSKYK